ncbi:MAG: hypothetical protein ACRCZS_02185 [Chroococcidiopsis sp.]
MSYVGRYIADDGVTTAPAIARLFENEQQDSRSVDGLEVVILRNPQATGDRPLYGVHSSERILQVNLIQHKSTTTHNLESAVTRIHELLPFAATGGPVRVNPEGFILAEYVIVIDDSDIDPADRSYSFPIAQP